VVVHAVLLVACAAPAPEPAVVEAPVAHEQPQAQTPPAQPEPFPAAKPLEEPPALAAPEAQTPVAAPPAAKPTTSPAASGCELAFDARIRRARGATFELTVTATNRTDAELRFELPSRCPAGPLDFTGLTREYDYYATCAMGMCMDRKPEVFTLAARERRQIVYTTIGADGDNCQPPLARAVYQIRPIVPELPFRTCVSAAKLDWTGTAK